MPAGLRNLARYLLGSLRDLAPIILVIAFFEIVVLQTVPDGLFGIIVGALMVLAGLTLFIIGLEVALFPIGESLAYALARKGSVAWLVVGSS